MHVKNNNGSIVIRGIPYPGVGRVNESLGLEYNDANRRIAEQKIEKIEKEMLAGKFDFARHFPKSKRLVAPKLAAPVAVPTLAEYAPEWLKFQTTKKDLRPETVTDYSSIINKHIITDEIASKPMRDITERDIVGFLGRLKQKPAREGSDEKLSARRINMVLARLQTIFLTAARERLPDGTRIVIDDPIAPDIKLREEKPEVEPFDSDEVSKLITSADGWFKNYLEIALGAGLRPNETFGLEWRDIDFAKGLIIVRRTMAKSGPRLPKTKSSQRDVPMTDAVRAALKRQQDGLLMPSGLVFKSRDGTPMILNNVRSRYWKPLLVKAKVRERDLYQCRHTYCVLRLTAGDDVRDIAREMGHSNISMLVTVYSRWSNRRADATTNDESSQRGREVA